VDYCHSAWRCHIYSVLVVGNEPYFGSILSDALTGADLEVAGVSDYSEAISELIESKRDIVVINIDLPSTNVLDACYYLHRAFNIPVIIVGKETEDVTWEKAVQAGADHLLEGPVSGIELAARIKAILRRYESG